MQSGSRSSNSSSRGTRCSSMNTVSRTRRMLAKSAVKSASRASTVVSAAAAAAPRSMAFGEHAAVFVGDGQRERASVFQLERHVGADEIRGYFCGRERQSSFDAVQAWNRQSRDCHSLIAADAIRDCRERKVAEAQRPDTGVFFDELQADSCALVAGIVAPPPFILCGPSYKLASNLHRVPRALERLTTK